MRKKYFLPVYIIIILVITIIMGFRPDYNWDMLPYMAILKKMNGTKSIDEVHKIVYTEAQKNIPQKKYADLVNAKDVYRKKMAENAYAFNTQLSYYTVKPIYLLCAYLFYKIGFSLTSSTFLPSLISFFFINIVSFFWISKLAIQLKAKLIMLMLICIVTLPLASRSNPDALSCLFLLLSSYYFLERNNLFLIVLFLILSILVRPENIIIAFLLYAVILAGKWKRQVPFYISLIYLTLIGACYYFLQKYMHSNGWSSLIYHAFINDTADPSVKQTITIPQYLKILQENILNIKGIAIFIFLSLLSVSAFLPKKLPFKTVEFFAIAVIIWCIVKTILFPMLGFRFLIPPALLLMLAGIKAYEYKFSN